MEAEQSYMTDLICDLALEIIYLQTGEKHAAVKMASIEGLLRGVYPMLAGGSMCLAPITKPPSHSRFPESNNLKILEVTKKITELLAGEVSSARNYGSVCSSMEKRKNVEKYRPLDPIMEDQLPIKSLDGSRERSSPERCPFALNSQDTTQENQEMTHQVQVNVEMKIKEEAIEELEEPYVRDDDQCAEDEISLENSVGSTEEGYSTPLHDQEEIILNIKEEEEPYVSGGEHLEEEEEEEMSPRISADWWHARGAQEKPHDIQLMNEIVHNLERSSLPAQRSARPEEKPYLCSECGKRFVSKSRLTQHRKTHMGEKLYSCSVCGKYFVNKSNLKEHTNIHTGEKPYACSYCGRCFSWKAVLTRHERVHTGEKPYSCLECGRSFSQKSHLTDHERTHTGEKVHICSECGKCFAKKSNLNTHRKTHAVKRPYSL